ncbi:MAG: pseudouridine synthase [Akkermansiaceae bacterium]
MTSTDKPLDILYQDEWLVAVNKPAGHLVHPADEPKEGDLVAMKILRDQIGERVYNIHRLDRPTCGVLLFGIDRNAARALHRALERHEVQKTYWAVVAGLAPTEPWECRQPLQKDETAPLREAHTSFRRLATVNPLDLAQEKTPTLSLIEATPHTGRYHQIRRHLLDGDLPIVGDYRYAGIESCDHLGKLLGTGTRMLLQSRSLAFRHPITGQHTLIEAPPDDLFLKCFPSL